MKDNTVWGVSGKQEPNWI